jgi:hypothetical protein
MPVPVVDARHQTVFKDPHAYAAHPHVVSLDHDEWLMVFNRSVRRPFVLHPPQDPHFYNVITRSHDLGATWSPPEVTPDYEWHGVETAGLTWLGADTVLLSQWQFRWLPLALARKRAATEELRLPADWAGDMLDAPHLDRGAALAGRAERLTPWARGSGGTFVHVSFDRGRTFEQTVRLDTAPYSGGYGMRGALVLPSGELVLPLSDVPSYRRVFVVRSKDRGLSWSAPSEVAAQDGRWFEEPALVRCPGGRIVGLLRENRSHSLHQVVSTDDGHTWSEPAPTPIHGYPPHLLGLPDGRLLCVYGHREPDYSIRAVVSVDEGRSWETDRTFVVRGGLPTKDLGYPSSVLRPDGRIFTVYYCQGEDGVTAIEGTTYSL